MIAIPTSSARGGGAGAAGMLAIVSLVLVLVLVLAGAGCGTSKPPVVDFSAEPRQYRPDDYAKVYERWTRYGKVPHEVESALEIWATFKSDDYREAFVAHYAAAYAMKAADREQLRQAQREAAATMYEFFLTAQSANYRWNDLEKKSSPWRVTLIDGLGHEMPPEELKLEKLPDIFEREFFPVKTPFTRTYSARFPRGGVKDGDKVAVDRSGEAGGEKGKESDFAGERTGRITLRVAGPMGRADLTWSAR